MSYKLRHQYVISFPNVISSNRGNYDSVNLYLHEVIEISVELFIIRVYFVSEKVTTYPFSVLKSFQSF